MVTTAEAQVYADSFGHEYFETSSKDYINVDEVFEALLRACLRVTQEPALTSKVVEKPVNKYIAKTFDKPSDKPIYKQVYKSVKEPEQGGSTSSDNDKKPEKIKILYKHWS